MFYHQALTYLLMADWEPYLLPAFLRPAAPIDYHHHGLAQQGLAGDGGEPMVGSLAVVGGRWWAGPLVIAMTVVLASSTVVAPAEWFPFSEYGGRSHADTGPEAPK